MKPPAFIRRILSNRGSQQIGDKTPEEVGRELAFGDMAETKDGSGRRFHFRSPPIRLEKSRQQLEDELACGDTDGMPYRGR